jgi:hypothetical protein
MLHISHKQTIAYHPESNRAVERLHHRLKDTLRARAAAATWSEELPFVLLGLRAQPKEDTGLSPAEAVFEVRIFVGHSSQEDWMNWQMSGRVKTEDKIVGWNVTYKK